MLPRVRIALAADAAIRFDRLCGEFPQIPIALVLDGEHEDRQPRVDPRDWLEDFERLWQLDEEVERCRALTILARPERDATRDALAVLTRYQRLWPRGQPGGALARVLERHRALHDLSRPLEAADFAHALDTWQWLVRLAPGASLPAQVAALFHDLERLTSEPMVRLEQHARDYDAFKDAHARAGAERLAALLEELPLAPADRRRAVALVRDHERPGADGERALLNDADALSFFSLNSPGYLSYFGREQTLRKVRWTRARLSERAATYLPGIALARPIAALLREPA